MESTETAGIAIATIKDEPTVKEEFIMPLQEIAGGLPDVPGTSSTSFALQTHFQDVKDGSYILDDYKSAAVSYFGDLMVKEELSTTVEESNHGGSQGDLTRSSSFLESPANLLVPDAASTFLVCDDNYGAERCSHLEAHAKIHIGPNTGDVRDGRRTKRHSSLKKHLNTSKGGKTFGCDCCDYITVSLARLEIHLRTHTGERPFACEFCEYRAGTKGSLKIHMTTHLNEKRHACNMCNYRAGRRDVLKTHIMSHTGEKPYACDLCEYRSVQHTHLKRHRRIHTGEKPYSCHMCDYKAGLLNHLRTHMRKHTGEKPYACDICDHRAAFLGNLVTHIKTHSV